MQNGRKILLWCIAGVFLLAIIVGFLALDLSALKKEEGSLVLASSAPPDTTSTSNTFAAVDDILARMQFGNVAFNAPQAMNLSEVASIQLLLSLTTPIEELKNSLEAAGAREGARIQVSNRMEARLTGYNFAITAVTPEVQAVSSDSTTQWRWDIKPTSEGKQYLHLTLSALINVDGESTPRSIRTFDKTIEVEITWQQKAIAFIKNNWQWLWAVVLTPIVGWLWKKRASV